MPHHNTTYVNAAYCYRLSRWGPDPSWEGAILRKRGTHCKV